jgi:hypothetical protein
LPRRPEQLVPACYVNVAVEEFTQAVEIAQGSDPGFDLRAGPAHRVKDENSGAYYCPELNDFTPACASRPAPSSSSSASQAAPTPSSHRTFSPIADAR